jgi:hypothetical protein
MTLLKVDFVGLRANRPRRREVPPARLTGRLFRVTSGSGE